MSASIGNIIKEILVSHTAIVGGSFWLGAHMNQEWNTWCFWAFLASLVLMLWLDASSRVTHNARCKLAENYVEELVEGIQNCLAEEDKPLSQPTRKEEIEKRN